MESYYKGYFTFRSKAQFMGYSKELKTINYLAVASQDRNSVEDYFLAVQCYLLF